MRLQLAREHQLLRLANFRLHNKFSPSYDVSEFGSG